MTTSLPPETLDPPTLFESLAHGAIGAVFGTLGVALFVLLPFYKFFFGDGVGFIDGLLTSPWSSWQCWVIAGAALGAIKSITKERTRRARASKTRSRSRKVGVEYRSEVGRSMLGTAQHLNIFSGWGDGGNYRSFRLSDGTAQMLDYTHVEACGDSSVEYEQTVVIFNEKPGSLPNFQLRPRNWETSLMETAGGQEGLEFLPYEKDSLGWQFVGKYIVHPGTYRLDFSNGTAEIESVNENTKASLAAADAVRRLFVLPVVKFLLGNPGWCIESRDGVLAMWKRGKVVQEADLQSFLQLAIRCRDLLQEGRKDPSARTLYARLHYPKEVQPEDAEAFHVLATLFWGLAGFIMGGAGGVAFFVSVGESGVPIWLCWVAAIFGLIAPAAGAFLAGRLAWKLLRKE